MRHNWKWLVLVLMLLTGGGLLSLPACNSQVYSEDKPLVDAQALEYYSQGKYRYSLEILKSKKDLNALEFYLMGRDYQELKEPDLAVQTFKKIQVEKLGEFPHSDFFLENYRYFFTQAMIDSPQAYPFSLVLVSNFVRTFKPESPYFEKMNSYNDYYQWKATNWQYFLSLKTPGPEEQRYLRLWAFGQGQVTNISRILSDYSQHAFSRPYRAVAEKLQSSELKNRQDLEAAIDLCRDFGQIDKARTLLAIHKKTYKDQDYYVRNKALLDYSKDRSQAIKDLQEWEKEGKASSRTASVLLNYLRKAGRNQEAMALALRSANRFGGSFYDDYIKYLKKTASYNTLYKWYNTKKSEKGFRLAYGPDVIRTMLRYKPEYVPELVQDYLAHHNSYSIQLISALWDYQKKSVKSAYQKFLRIRLEYPYTYEWLVASRYEQALRPQYKEEYSQTLQKKIAQLKEMTLKEQVYLGQSYRELDSSLLDKGYGIKLLEKKTAEYHAAIEKEMKVAEPIKTLEQWADSSLLAWNTEILNYVYQDLQNSSKGNKYLKFRYTWHHRGLFKKLISQGDIVSQLNTLMGKIVEERRFHPVLALEMQKELYPLEVFDELVSQTTSTNTSLWILSSFREESHFRKKVVSWVGAQGYGQLMPYTANILKKNMKRPELSTYDFADNVLLGVVLFKDLFRRYKDNYAYALGAYNGGEGSVNRWRKNFKSYDNELWIECVEFDETREYIKKIMVTRYFYERLYGFPAFQYPDFSANFK